MKNEHFCERVKPVTQGKALRRRRARSTRGELARDTTFRSRRRTFPLSRISQTDRVISLSRRRTSDLLHADNVTHAVFERAFAQPLTPRERECQQKNVRRAFRVRGRVPSQQSRPRYYYFRCNPRGVQVSVFSFQISAWKILFEKRCRSFLNSSFSPFRDNYISQRRRRTVVSFRL